MLLLACLRRPAENGLGLRHERVKIDSHVRRVLSPLASHPHPAREVIESRYPIRPSNVGTTDKPGTLSQQIAGELVVLSIREPAILNERNERRSDALGPQ